MADPVQLLAAAVSDVAGVPVALERPTDPAHGDYSTNVALRLASELKQPPREVAQELADRVVALPEVERAEVAGPGFLNLFLADGWFAQVLGEALTAGSAFGGGSASPPERVQHDDRGHSSSVPLE